MDNCKQYSEKCYYCSNWIVIGGVGMCINDLDDEEQEAKNDKSN